MMKRWLQSGISGQCENQPSTESGGSSGDEIIKYFNLRLLSLTNRSLPAAPPPGPDNKDLINMSADRQTDRQTAPSQ